jgi:predicted transcriptional regulator
MACISLDGELTDSGRKILSAAQEASLPEELAHASSMPLFKVRSSLRELTDAGFMEESEGKYEITSLGKEKLKL